MRIVGLIVGLTGGPTAAACVVPPMREEGLRMEMWAGAGDSTTLPARQPDPSVATPTLLVGTRSPEARVECARAPSAASAVAERQGAFPRAEAPASAEAGVFVAGAAALVAADGGNRSVADRS